MSSPSQDPQIPAPPGEIFAPEHLAISRRAAWALVLTFLLLLGVPPLVQDWRELRKGASGWWPARELVRAVAGTDHPHQPIEERLRGFDAGLSRLEFTQPPRQWAQQIVTTALRRGNDRTFLGQDGWLFYRPEIQALIGYGPVLAEPHSVSRDPALLDWEPPLAPIREFALALRERGVALWLVPVPMKPSLYPEKLTGQASPSPVRHPDTPRFYASLAATGLRVIDLADGLWALKTNDPTAGPVYLRDDTHWTPRGMAWTAGELARQVRHEAWFAALPPVAYPNFPAVTTPVRGFGDLVEKLGARAPEQLFEPASLTLTHWPDPAGGPPAPPDRESPIVLLGDSFVNIFDDPGLGFAPSSLPPGQRIGAGLAAHLAQALQRPLDVHAVNGEGATGVRRWLAGRGDSALRSKKLVIWVLSERDLILSRSLAKANRVEWKTTPIAADPALPSPNATASEIVVEARLLEKSATADPASANYANALYTARYEIIRTVSGQALTGPLEVAHWNFRQRQVQPTARLTAGRLYRLTLKPWSACVDLHPVNLELLEADPVWFSESALEQKE